MEMNKVDTNSMNKLNEAFENAYIKLIRSYDSTWNDDVHDSYAAYNDLIRNHKNRINGICNMVKKISTTIPDNTDVIMKANNIMSKVSSL